MDELPPDVYHYLGTETPFDLIDPLVPRKFGFRFCYECPLKVLRYKLLFALRTAYDVTLTDNSWDKATFEVVNGNTSKSWERLDA